MTWRYYCPLLVLWGCLILETNSTNITSNETASTTNASSDGTETTTEAITTTLDPFVELCQTTQVNYEVDKCYCQLDACLDAVFELEDLEWCPTCSIEPPTTTPIPPSTTTFDWATLFTSTANGSIETNGTVETNGTTAPSNNATTTQTTTTTMTSTISTVNATTIGSFGNNTTTFDGIDNVTISNETTGPELLLRNHSRCSLVAYGIQLKDLSTYSGGLCCCPEYKGERIHVALNVSSGDLQHGYFWTNALEDHRHPMTNDLLKRLRKELTVLAKYAFREKLIAFRFHGIRRVNFLYVGVTFTLTLPQSRVDNDVFVKTILGRTIGQYNNLTAEEGIFNLTYTGYTKTRYDELSIQTRRILDQDLLPKKNATQASLVEDGDNETDIALVILVILGAILFLALLVYVLCFSRSCFCKSWFT